MTTTVTVPVEPTEAMIDAYFDTCRRNGFLAHINATAAWSAMLSAAPAPEGGAVAWTPWNGGSNPLPDFGRHVEARLRNGRIEKAYSSDFRWQHHDYETDIVAYRIPTLAAREEAPAEAGEEDLAARLRRAETWDLDADQEARDRCGILMLEAAERLEALRAQPPAREDAQPVAWSQDQHDYDALTVIADHLRDNPAAPFSGRQCQEFVQAARDAQFTHPAPDALRIAVEALEAAKALAMKYAALSVAPKIIKALDALQAEQKGGA